MSLRQIVLDTETTGLSVAEGHRIIEIGCVELTHRQISGKTFHHYVNPQRAIDIGAQQVHGITLEFLADKPLFTHISEEFFEFIKDAELIIHNAPFDVSFLDHEFKLVKPGYLSIAQHCTITDTLALARKKHPGQQNSLDALCKRYGVDNSRRDLHGALLDAHLLAQVYLAMTGGQTSFFVEQKAEAANKIAKESKVVVKTARTLKVVPASDIELKAHNEALERIRKASNNRCLYEEKIESV